MLDESVSKLRLVGLSDCTLRSRRTPESSPSPNRNGIASGISRTDRVLERTNLTTSVRTTSVLNRSVRYIAIAGLICQTVRMIGGHEV